MAPFVGLIKDLQPGKSKYALRLRMIRSYKIPQIQNPDEVYSHEMVLHDHEGNRIHGSIEKASIPAFQDKLHEGNIYLMMNFIVAPNMIRTKTTTCPYKIILFKQTRMSEILDDSFPSYLLNLKSFDEIVSLEKKLDTPLFDVMGIVVKHFDVEEKSINGRMAKSMDIIIEDLEKKKMKCTLWDAYADEVDGIIKDHTKDGLEEPIAVVLKFCRTSTFRGELRVTNSYHVTQIQFSKVAEMENMHISFTNMNKDILSTMKMVHVPKSRARTIEDEIDEGECMFKTINELSAFQSGKFWIYGTIYGVETIGGYSYLACKLCFKKLKKDDNAFHCDSCETYDVGGRTRYKANIKMADDSGVGRFILWDRECLQLIGEKPAEDLSVDASSSIMPINFDSLMNKSALFKIHIKQHELEMNKGAYMISKVCMDPELIAKYGQCEEKEMEEKEGFSNDDITTSTTNDATPKGIESSESKNDEEEPIVFKRSKKIKAEKN